MTDEPTTESAHQVDPWRFAGSFLKRVLSGGIPEQPSYSDIPWAPVRKPLSESRVALLTTAGVSSISDTPFDMEMERQKPTRGDPSWRRLPHDATSTTIEANHLHIDTGYILRDLNVALPLDRLRELVEAGSIGKVAESHYSIMGYQGNVSSELVGKSAPEISQAMKNDQVDLIVLAPV
jgi:hypothetical protein